MKVGFACGVFDLFHDGHRHFLQHASLRCDRLIVAVNHDRWCQRKGPARPFDDLKVRMWNVETAVPDAQVIPFSGNDLALAAEISPDVIFRGWDQREDTGLIPVVRIGQLPGFSTTLLASTKEPK
jgi:glycerol-3-phosphate cytidylyltransferase